MSEPVNVRILDRDYLVSCEPGEREGLVSAAHLLDARMREIRGGNRMAAIDRIAVMAALNIAHELLRVRHAPAAAAPASTAASSATIDGTVAQRRIRDMHAAIDQLMAGQEKLF